MTYAIHSNLTLTASQGEAPIIGTDAFKTQKQLLALATAWPTERWVASGSTWPA